MSKRKVTKEKDRTNKAAFTLEWLIVALPPALAHGQNRPHCCCTPTHKRKDINLFESLVSR
ncbi:hypothetical protein GXP67_18420 [Rhodocytophaga rosea]|uniref:Uncharacterized protein n=1 Tax=Rhodocytophaga rosea TaxID=2704465 RepID=A0A6C0GKB3_9BACT|nr:hypothetical protein [Rhodocytophaga rosea]QHT68476.1 hypothetical protein GXP67_18420 [Rhodocytophaga rosea]